MKCDPFLFFLDKLAIRQQGNSSESDGKLLLEKTLTKYLHLGQI